MQIARERRVQNAPFLFQGPIVKEISLLSRKTCAIAKFNRNIAEDRNLIFQDFCDNLSPLFRGLSHFNF